MADGFTFLRDEKVMLTQKVTYFYNRMIAAPGMLHLTNKRLVFVPTSLLDRTLGAKGVAVPLRSIQDVSLEGSVDRRLVVRTDHEQMSFKCRSLSQEFLDRLRSWSGETQATRARPRSREEEERGGAVGAAVYGNEPTPVQTPPPRKTEKIRLDPVDLGLVDESKEVLILGDTEFYGVSLSHILDRLHLRRAVFQTAEEALAALSELPGHYSLMIVNILEPASGGIQFLEKRKSEGLANGLPTWVIEELFDKLPEGVLEGLGVTGFMNKSVEPNETSDVLNRLFRGEATPQIRRHPRVTQHFPVEFVVGGERGTAYVSKLGTGGMFVDSDKPFPLGTQIDLRFKVPGSDEVLEASGSVVYMVPKKQDQQRKSPGMGIRFREIRSEHQSLIRSFIVNVLQEEVNEVAVIFGA